MKLLPLFVSLFAFTAVSQADILVYSGTGQVSGGNASGSLPTLNGKVSVVMDVNTYETRVIAGTKAGPLKKVATTNVTKVGATQVKKGDKVSTVFAAGISTFTSKTNFKYLFARYSGATKSIVIKEGAEPLDLPKSLSGAVNVVDQTNVAATTGVLKFNSTQTLDMNKRGLSLDTAVTEIEDSYK